MKAAQLDLYEAGDYAALSATMRPAALELVRRSGADRGDLVLDVAAGDGNVAVAVAAVGARAVACDLSAVQLQRARMRDPDLTAVAADAEVLPFGDGVFDHVLSAFGAVCAPHPEQALEELFRVCRRGGTVAITAWPHDSFMGEITQVVRSHAPDPASFPDQDLGWGEAHVAGSRFAAYADEVEVHRLSIPWDLAVRRSAGERDFAARYLAGTMPGFDLGEYAAEVVARHTDDSGTLVAEYLLVLGRA